MEFYFRIRPHDMRQKDFLSLPDIQTQDRHPVANVLIHIDRYQNPRLDQDEEPSIGLPNPGDQRREREHRHVKRAA